MSMIDGFKNIEIKYVASHSLLPTLEQYAMNGEEWAVNELKRREIVDINARFVALDLSRSRPLAAYALGMQTPADTARLEEIEAEAKVLRTRLAELGK